jgi:hypothetical protein
VLATIGQEYSRPVIPLEKPSKTIKTKNDSLNCNAPSPVIILLHD